MATWLGWGLGSMPECLSYGRKFKNPLLNIEIKKGATRCGTF
jgi:hypothetical protein